MEYHWAPRLAKSASLKRVVTGVMRLNFVDKKLPKWLNHITCNSAVGNNSGTSVKIPAVARSQKYAQHHKSYCIKIPEIKAWIMLPRKQACHHCLEVPGGICPSKEFILIYQMPFCFPFFLNSERQWLKNATQLISEYEHVKSFWETVMWLFVLRENWFLWYLRIFSFPFWSLNNYD